MRITRLFAIAAVFIALASMDAAASGWEARLAGHPSLPQKFFAVDKDSQTFFLYSRKSPLRLIGSFPCTTGREPGDKSVEGDLRTPEGVYFIKGRLHRTLDWSLYGNLAYELNFPNPVDRIKGKTGYGIWVHGRGKKLVPRDTRGCVALNTPDLQAVGDDISPGLPVVISQSLDVAADEASSPELDHAVKRVYDWAEAWQRRSSDFFSFYDAKAYDKAQERSFEAFTRRKQMLFKRHDWIQVMVNDVRVLPGPDYLVTYFRQYYRTPTMVSEGVKRLYWQPGADGELRIVGREWIKTPRTLDAEYLKRVASEVAPVIEGWRAAWERADLDGYAGSYAYGAEQGDRLGVAAIKDHKRHLWSVSPPEKVRLGKESFDFDPRGVRVTFTQTYTSAGGYEDRGVKELVLSPMGEGWKIVREDWRAM